LLSEVIEVEKQEYIVRLRRSDVFKVKPNAEQIDGKKFFFEKFWTIDEDDTDLPIVGEFAMVPCRNQRYPDDAPHWIASGDLEKCGT
jgi:hypothetical protein